MSKERFEHTEDGITNYIEDSKTGIIYIGSNYYDMKYMTNLLNQQQQLIAGLEEQLKNAIIPKFKIGQEVYAINVLRKDCVDGFIINEIGYCANYGIYYKTNEGINLYEYYYAIFATYEEAQAKLEEMKNE